MRFKAGSAVDAVITLVDLPCLTASFVPGPGRFGKAIGTKTADIFRWLRVEQSLDEKRSDAGRARDAVGIAAPGHYESRDGATFTENKAPIRREGRPAFADTRLLGGVQLGEQL